MKISKSLKVAVIATSLATGFCHAETVSVEATVCDEEGGPVTNAVVHIRSLRFIGLGAGSSNSHFAEFEQETDGAGKVTMRFDCPSADFQYWVSAPECYSTERQSGHFKMVQSQSDLSLKLLEKRKDVSVTLRRKHNPIRMVGYGAYSNIRIPRRGGTIGFDLEKGDFVAPDGAGRVADLYLTQAWSNVVGIATGCASLSFEGVGNGAYIATCKDGSLFKSDYIAETNVTFATRFEYSFGREENIAKQGGNYLVEEGRYLVLRTRCVVDEAGKVRKCHYSKIYGPLSIEGGRFCFKSYAFNPNCNDPNLEFDVSDNIMRKDTGVLLP